MVQRRDMQQHEGHTLASSFANLAMALDALKGMAPVQHPQQIIDLLPFGSLESRRLIFVELIKADLQAAAAALSPRDLEFYWPAADDILPRELVQIELLMECARLRKQLGAPLDWEKYVQAFPGAVDTIAPNEGGTRVLTDLPNPQALPQLLLGATYEDFSILRELGSGSFAFVYLARQESMHRLVALKVSERSSDEPRALSQLDHPNIVRVFDQRTLQRPAANLLYMQYVPGGTLADCVKHLKEIDRRQWSGNDLLGCIDLALLQAHQSHPERSTTRASLAKMTWPEVVAWLGIQIADGLDYSDRKGILHRDIKPANILLTSEGVPKLADFNVSATLGTEEGRSAANFGGSLAYMSPEQLRVADQRERDDPSSLDIRSDLYSLGILLWELWQGERPWKAEPCMSMSEAIAEQRRLRNLPVVAKYQAQTPSERMLEKVLLRLMHPERDQRPSSGREVMARLQLALQPELARRFEPHPKSLAGRLRRIPLLMLASVVVFAPNVAASVFNYWYNWFRMSELKSMIPSVEQDFKLVADWVNWIVFPLGIVLFLVIMLPIARIRWQGEKGMGANPTDFERLWLVGRKATLICTVLWAVSGAVFAGSFAWMHPGKFQPLDAFHFFMSLVLCGGVAGIYPYFGMSLLAVLIYYPQIVAVRMVDEEFDKRVRRLLYDNSLYLLLAATIPLTAVTLLVFRQNLTRGYVLFGTSITLLGLLAAYFAHRRLEQVVVQYSRIFSMRLGETIEE